MKLTLSEYGSISEILGGIAIVVSLAILIVEVRENTATIKRQMAHDRARSVNLEMIQTAELPRILDKIKQVDGHRLQITAFMDKYELTAEESIRWNRHLTLIWQGIEADYLVGSEDAESVIFYAMRFPDNQLFFETIDDGLFDKEFIDFVRSAAPSQ